MHHNGYMIQKIRKSKQLTQGELADGIVTKNYLSKFERGQCHISGNLLLNLLQKLNIYPSEFEVWGLKEKNNQQQFLEKLADAVHHEDIHLFEKLLKEEEKLSQTDYNVRHTHNKILLKNYINHTANLPIDQDSMKIITDYLFMVDDWGRYELSLFGNSVMLLPSTISHRYIASVTKKTQLYQHSRAYMEQVYRILLNILFADIEQRQWRNALEVVEQLEYLLQHRHFFYEQLKFIFFKGIIEICTGDKEEGKEQCQQCIQQLYFFNESSLAQDYKQLLTYYLDL